MVMFLIIFVFSDDFGSLCYAVALVARSTKFVADLRDFRKPSSNSFTLRLQCVVFTLAVRIAQFACC